MCMYWIISNLIKVINWELRFKHYKGTISKVTTVVRALCYFEYKFTSFSTTMISRIDCLNFYILLTPVQHKKVVLWCYCLNGKTQFKIGLDFTYGLFLCISINFKNSLNAFLYINRFEENLVKMAEGLLKVRTNATFNYS